MVWLVVGYLFLFIFRPYEYWEFLGTLHVERIYMVIMLLMVMTSKKTSFVTHEINRAVCGFFLVITLASLFAFRREDAFPVVYDYFKLIVFYFVIIMSIRDEKDLRVFVLAYLVIMFMYFGKSAWEFFVHGRHWWRMGIKRMMGIDITYGDPNYFAASIAYSLPFWWSMFKLNMKGKATRLFLWAYITLALVCIIYSGSRSGMVTALLMFVLIWLSSNKRMWGVVLIPVLLAGLWAVMPETYQVRFESILAPEIAENAGQGGRMSAQGRILGLKLGFETFLNKPLLGIGPGNFKYITASWLDGEFGMSAHNLYGQILGETGGIGFAAFFIFIWLTVRCCYQNYRKSKRLLAQQDDHTFAEGIADMRLLNIIATASMQVVLLLLFNGNFGHNLYRYNYLWVAAIAVISSSILYKREREALG